MTPAPARTLAVALLVAAATGAHAAAPGEPVSAVRREGPIAVDGLLGEPDWDRAVPFDGFVQVFPAEGAPPSEATTVRVLHDDRTLYVGVSCRDRQPHGIRRPLGRRDAALYGDAVTVVIDSVLDGRNAFVFTVTAAGVLSDGIQSADDDYSADWDAVWEGAAAATAEGWSAELAIPLAALRFGDRPDPVFGFAVKRTVGRTQEQVVSVLLPRSARGQVARLGRLVGLSGLSAAREVAVAPYVAARVGGRPQYDDAERPRPRLWDPVAEVGVDVRASIGRGLALQGTINPDFGQVEADQIIQNLSTFEIFFPEKRPFFTQGMEIFRPVSAVNQQSPQQLFYSRRVGLEAPILAAAKLTGSVSDTVEVGLLDALVTGAGSGAPEEDPDRSVGFSPRQPLRLGPSSALPSLAPPTQNFLAAVARWRPDPTASFGATATSALLVGPRCTPEQDALDDDVRPRRCDALAGNAAALDFALRTRDGAWFARGQVAGSQAQGGAPRRVLADGTVLERGDVGLGAHAVAGRQGGEPWRFDLQWEYQSPELELNAAGFQRTQNEQLGRAVLRHVRPGGVGPFHSTMLQLGVEARRTTDGRGLDRGRQVWVAGEAQLRALHWFGGAAWLDLPRWDVREIEETGVAYERPAGVGFDAWFATDAARPLRAEVGVGGGATFADGPLREVAYWAAATRVTLRPHARVETRAEVRYDFSHWPARWVLDDETGRSLFADLTAPAFSVTLRQQVVLTTRLSLQAYAQLFTSYGRYERWLSARASGDRIRIADLAPLPPGTDPASLPGFENPDFREGALNVNVVLRWEPRPGATLFLVYTRAQEELGYPDDPLDPSPRATLRPHRLSRGPTEDTFLVKWTTYWSG